MTTIQMMRNNTDSNTLMLDFPELAAQYQETHEDKYLAAAFVKLYPQILNVGNHHINIDFDEKISLALIILQVCLETYTPKAKFITMFTHYYNNELTNKIRTDKYQKRKINNNTVSLDAEVDCDYDNCILKNIIATEDDSKAAEIKVVLYNQSGLSKTEQYILHRVLEGYNLAEIGRELNLTRACISIRFRKIKVKIKNSLQLD